MKIEKTFKIAAPLDRTWEAFSDVYLVADCLPGAQIVEDLGNDRYRGRFVVKLGPMTASFDGDVEITRNPMDHSGAVTGKGQDMRSGSRASGGLNYRLQSSDDGGTWAVVVTEVNLSGALAQFGKAGVIREVANRLTAAFVENFEVRMRCRPGAHDGAVGAPGTASTATAPLDAGRLGWVIIKAWFIGLFRRSA